MRTNLTAFCAVGAGGYPHADDDDLRGAAEQASKHAGDSGDRDLFSSIISALGDKKQALASEDVDEQGISAHWQT